MWWCILGGRVDWWVVLVGIGYNCMGYAGIYLEECVGRAAHRQWQINIAGLAAATGLAELKPKLRYYCGCGCCSGEQTCQGWVFVWSVCLPGRLAGTAYSHSRFLEAVCCLRARMIASI